MSDRKYRQRGYMDGDRDREPRRPQGSPGQPQQKRPFERPEGPKTPNLMAARQVIRCARCGAEASPPVGALSRCAKCAVDLHTCIQCDSFSPGSTFECVQPVKARIAPKDVRNACKLFAAKTTIERETHSAAPASAKKAFDDLFKI